MTLSPAARASRSQSPARRQAEAEGAITTAPAPTPDREVGGPGGPLGSKVDSEFVRHYVAKMPLSRVTLSDFMQHAVEARTGSVNPARRQELERLLLREIQQTEDFQVEKAKQMQVKSPADEQRARAESPE